MSIHAICMISTAILFIMTVIGVLVERYAVIEEGNGTPANLRILYNWLLIGTIPLAIFGTIQWYLLVNMNNWFYELASTALFIGFYVWLYWGKAMKKVVEHIEGVDFNLAAGNNPRQNGLRKTR